MSDTRKAFEAFAKGRGLSVDIDQVALETVQAISEIDPDKLMGGKAQAMAQAQCLVIDAIERCLPTQGDAEPEGWKLDLHLFAKRMDAELEKHDIQGFEPVVLAVAEEVLGYEQQPAPSSGVPEGSGDE